MNDYLSSHVLIIALTFFLAGIVKGVAGMGLPTVAMGVLSAIMSPVSAHGLLAKPLSIPARFERLLSPVIGLTTGVINGGTGIFTLPAVPYLQVLGLAKDDLIQALGLSFTVSTIALATGLARGGAFHLGNITLSALAVIPALLGMRVGTTVRERISVATFRRWFLILIAILGLELAVHPFFF
jgi:uncharacterized protein